MDSSFSFKIMSTVESCIDNLSKICRLCMKIGKNVRSIFNDNHKYWAMTDISKLIYDCTNVEVTVNDSTTVICVLCYKQLQTIVKFRERCKRTNELLQKQWKQDEEFIPKSENLLNENDSENSQCIPQLAHLDEEGNDLRSNSLWTKDASFGEISDLETTAPDPYESEEQINNSTSEDIQNRESTLLDDGIGESEDISNRSLSKPKRKMKYSTKQTQKCSDDWPMLKIRDLVERKAYRGLCHLCGKEYQHLWVHLQSHSDVPTETCDICGKGFRSKANLSLHILLHKDADMPCERCGKKYRTKMRLKRHMRVHTQERPFFCSVCQKRFYTKYNLEVHGRIHSGERPFSCTAKNCNERFAHSYALKHHMEKVHKH